MEELIKKIKEFEKKSGLNLLHEIQDDLFKVDKQLKRVTQSRDSWSKKNEEQKEKIHALENHIETLEAGN